jgi:hypothetical protein
MANYQDVLTGQAIATGPFRFPPLLRLGLNKARQSARHRKQNHQRVLRDRFSPKPRSIGESDVSRREDVERQRLDPREAHVQPPKV